MARNTRSAGIAVAVGALSMALAGCLTSSPPRLQVEGARAAQGADGRSVVYIDVVATNPNREGLPLRGVKYTVDVSGERVFEGVRDAQASVRGYGVQRFTLPVPVNGVSVASGSAPFRVKGEVTYIAPEVLARTLFDNGIRSWTTGFSGEGVVAAGR